MCPDCSCAIRGLPDGAEPIRAHQSSAPGPSGIGAVPKPWPSKSLFHRRTCMQLLELVLPLCLAVLTTVCVRMHAQYRSTACHAPCLPVPATAFPLLGAHATAALSSEPCAQKRKELRNCSPNPRREESPALPLISLPLLPQPQAGCCRVELCWSSILAEFPWFRVSKGKIWVFLLLTK